MFFNEKESYTRVQSPGGRVLLVQGEVSLWEGYPPNDAFETPGWARSEAADTQIPATSEDRAAALLDDVKSMKENLKGAASELGAGKKKLKT